MKPTATFPPKISVQRVMSTSKGADVRIVGNWTSSGTVNDGQPRRLHVTLRMRTK